MLVSKLAPALPIEFHDAALGFDSRDLQVRIEPEVRNDDLDLAEPSPTGVDLAGRVFEAVRGGLIGGVRACTGEPGHGVRGGLAGWKPGASPPRPIDRDVTEPPAVREAGKAGDPLPPRAACGLPVCDRASAADDDLTLCARRRRVHRGALGGARIFWTEDERLGQFVTTRLHSNHHGL